MFVKCCFVLFILVILAYVLSKQQERETKRSTECIDKRNSEYVEKLRNWCNLNNIIFNENILNTKEVWVKHRHSVYTPGYIWFDNKNIIFCPDSVNCGNLNIEENVVFIKFEDIKYYTKDGTITYTNDIINNGRNISISGTLIGGMIAGETGAIIGSRKDMNKIENKTIEHDETHTYIYFLYDNDIKVIDIKGNGFYNSILHIMPEKEYFYLLYKDDK